MGGRSARTFAAPRRRLPARHALGRRPTIHGDATRRRVVDAAIASLAREGMAGTTAAAIARRAGLSWGVIQYYFGDRAGVLRAVLDTVFDRFAGALAAGVRPGGTIERRLERLVELAWALVRRDEYRAGMEILRHAQADPELARELPARLEAWSEGVAAVWNGLFPEPAARGVAGRRARTILFGAVRAFAEDEWLHPGWSARHRRADLRAVARAAATLLRERPASRR